MYTLKRDLPRQSEARRSRSDGVTTARSDLVALVLLAGACFADLQTGYELSSSLFYIIPVAYAAWFTGRARGMGVAVMSAAAWLVCQRVGGMPFSRPGILFANAAAELAIYFGTAWTVSRVAADADLQRRLTAHANEAREALDREFLAVGQLQRGLLPRELPRMPGYAWEVHYATSTRAGGDYYDGFRLQDGRVGVVVADATGHGAPAAVLMAMGRALLGAQPSAMSHPAEVLERLNQQLGRMLPPGWFLTAAYLTLDPGSGRFEYALAGHDPPLIVRARDRSVAPLEDRAGLPLGPFPDRRYVAGEELLDPGDTLVMFTDGVTETMNASNELFGLERLRASLASTAAADLAEVQRELLVRLDRHAGGRPREDDTTIVLLRRLASE